MDRYLGTKLLAEAEVDEAVDRIRLKSAPGEALFAIGRF